MSSSFPHTLRLVLAALLSLPALLLLLAVAPIIFVLSTPSLAILVRRKRNLFPSFADSSAADSSRSYPLLQHAVVTGGSSGIGLSIALELARRGCENITLLARKEGQSAEAKKLVEEAVSASMLKGKGTKATTVVRTISIDITDDKALNKVAEDLCREVGPPSLIFNCAGVAVPLDFEDLSQSNFRSQVKLNYLGSTYIVKAFLPYMEQQNHIGGNIVLTSSMSGQAGTYGYSAYSPTKFAIRGFAECLSMELAAHKSNVNIMLAYPPDTNTPGYEVENQSKPEACRLISESGGIWEPDVVGKKIVKEALKSNPTFDIYFGIDGWMLSMLTSGMNPVTSVFDAVCQVALMGLLRFISLFYLMDFGRLTQNCADQINAKDASKED
jgi:3-dehydrosphinganine reductase